MFQRDNKPSRLTVSRVMFFKMKLKIKMGEQKCNSCRIIFTAARQNNSRATQRDRQLVLLHSHESGNLSHPRKTGVCERCGWSFKSGTSFISFLITTKIMTGKRRITFHNIIHLLSGCKGNVRSTVSICTSFLIRVSSYSEDILRLLSITGRTSRVFSTTADREKGKVSQNRITI